MDAFSHLEAPHIQKAFHVPSYEESLSAAAQGNAITSGIMPAVRGDIQKGWKQLPNVNSARSAKSWFYDPLTLQYSLGYKDRRFSLTYDMLKKVAAQLSIVNSIINTRSAQVASFAQPFRTTRSLGYMIRHKDSDHATTNAEVEFIKELESFVQNCGRVEPNPYSRTKRDDFEDFLRKIIRDTLTFDQLCFEVVPDLMGVPYEFIAVDAATIRLASDDRYVGINSSFHQREGFVPSVPSRFAGLYEGREYGRGDIRTADGQQVEFVQIINGQIENVYSNKDLAFGVRNPRTDIYIQGYGYGELEQLITIITAHLYAEEYNRKFFSQGSSPKGILNLKGDNWTSDQLEEFQRHWQAQVSGAENAWKTPVLQSEGLEWIDFSKTNRDMEFGNWMEYLIKVTCGVFLIDPAELNFDMHGGVQQTPLFESSQEWKLKASRDRGLKPLLRFLAKQINKNVIDRIDDHFTLEFVGLDELSEQDKHNMVMEQVASYMTLNEVRRQMDLTDLPGGDIPMNPTYLEAMKLKMEQEQAEGQMDIQREQGGLTEGAPLPGSDETAMDQGPNYSSQFGMEDPATAFKSFTPNMTAKDVAKLDAERGRGQHIDDPNDTYPNDDHPKDKKPWFINTPTNKLDYGDD